jgi:hypothetical protein
MADVSTANYPPVMSHADHLPAGSSSEQSIGKIGRQQDLIRAILSQRIRLQDAKVEELS